MSINLEQFAATNQAAVNSLLSVVNTALASAERLTNLNLETARSALENSASSSKAMLGATDPKEAFSLQASLAQPNVEKAVAYSRSVMEISTQAQQEITKTLEAQFGDFQKSITELLEKAAKSAPAGSEIAVSSVQSAFAAANSAFENMTKAAKQMTDLAQSNVAATTSATTKAAKKATTK